MSFLPDLSSLSDSFALSSLKFTFAELQVLIHALRVYHGFLEDEEDNNHSVYYSDDGSLEKDVCDKIYVKLLEYSFS